MKKQVSHDISPVKFECRVRFEHRQRARKLLQIDTAAPAKSLPGGRIPRVARLMALAIRFERLIATGEVRDYAELARLGHVTRARATQIMNLLNLAPDIQEAVLFLPPVEHGRDPIKEWMLRPIAALVPWSEQRKQWSTLAR